MGSLTSSIADRLDEQKDNVQENEQAKSDPVNKPKHYTGGGIECIEAIEEATKDLTGIEAVCTANALKYIWRWKKKNGIEDLKKAQWYLNRLIMRNS